jgi:uncharacterized lipoprotein YmbA
VLSVIYDQNLKERLERLDAAPAQPAGADGSAALVNGSGPVATGLVSPEIEQMNQRVAAEVNALRDVLSPEQLEQYRQARASGQIRF